MFSCTHLSIGKFSMCKLCNRINKVKKFDKLTFVIKALYKTKFKNILILINFDAFLRLFYRW